MSRRVSTVVPLLLLMLLGLATAQAAAPSRALAALTLTAPNGGEVLHAGQFFKINWQPPAGTGYVKLWYSIDGGAVWRPITTKTTSRPYNWKVPAQTGNMTRCFVKVQAFRSDSTPIAVDTSNRAFSILVVDVTTPAPGARFLSNRVASIAWQKYATKAPVAAIDVFYSLDGGSTWTKIKRLAGTASSLDWTPVVTVVKTQCKVRVDLRDAANKSLGSARNKGFFVIEPPRSDLALREYRPWNRSLGAWRYFDHVWASVTIRNKAGDLVTGRTLDDFVLTEKLLDADRNVVEERTITFDEPLSQFDGPGFWERSVTGEKLDLVFLLSVSEIHAGDIPAAVAQMKAFVDRLVANRTDFRLGIVVHGDGRFDYSIPFRGPMMADDLKTAMDGVGTDGANLNDSTCGWDSFFHALGGPFRTNARKVVVVISDAPYQTVYGNDLSWNPTAANLEIVQLLARQLDVEMLYSLETSFLQADFYKSYVDPAINPRAAEDAGGFPALKAAGLAQDIGWPFDQSRITLAAPAKPVESRYYFAWLSRFDPAVEDPRIRVSIATENPDSPGTQLGASFEYPYWNEAAFVPVSVTLRDEKGAPLGDPAVELYAVMGDRLALVGGDSFPTGGLYTMPEIPVGPYKVGISDANPYGAIFIRFDDWRDLTVAAPGTSAEWTVPIGDRTTELAKAHGLAADLAAWGVIDKPFQGVAAGARSWVDSLDSGGIDTLAMERLKRLHFGLAGYTGASGYADQEAKRIVEDTVVIVKKFREVLAKIRELAASTDEEWAASVALASFREDYPALAELGTIEATVQALKEYAENQLAPEVIAKIVELAPAGQYKETFRVLAEQLIKEEFADWGAVLQTVADTALGTALNELKNLITSELVARLGTSQVETLIKGVLQTVVHDGFGGLNPYLTSVKPLLDQLALDLTGTLAQVDEAFAVLENDGTGEQGGLESNTVTQLKRFVLPLLKTVVIAAVQGQNIDTDLIIEKLTHFFCQKFIVEAYFSDPVLTDLQNLLAGAQAWVPGPSLAGGQMNLQVALQQASVVYGAVEQGSWDAMGAHDVIDNMHTWLPNLFNKVDFMQPVCAGVCLMGYPAMCSASLRLDELAAVLDGLTLITKATDLVLRVGDVTDLADRLGPLNDAALRY